MLRPPLEMPYAGTVRLGRQDLLAEQISCLHLLGIQATIHARNTKTALIFVLQKSRRSYQKENGETHSYRAARDNGIASIE